MTEAIDAYADELYHAVADSLGPWVVGCVARASGRDDVDCRAAVAGACDDVLPKLRALLNTDIDEQRTNPLAILRSAVRYPTGVLRELRATPAARDQFARRAFPDDEYDLTPAAFADFGPAVHEAGVAWGAAKAFLHLRRRAER